MRNIDENLRMVEGNIKHEGMILTDDERKLIKRFANKELSRKELIEENCILKNKGTLKDII